MGEPKEDAAPTNKVHRAQGMDSHSSASLGTPVIPHPGASSHQAPKKSRMALLHQVREMAYGRIMLCEPGDHTAKKQKSQKFSRAWFDCI